jgi:hypothetical protein
MTALLVSALVAGLVAAHVLESNFIAAALFSALLWVVVISAGRAARRLEEREENDG